jgi:hypothetical protein
VLLVAFRSSSYAQVYEAALGHDFAPPPYRASYAVLLENNLNRAYHRFKWSFYTQVRCFPLSCTHMNRCMIKGDNLVVHVFHGVDSTLRAFHGKVITPDRFRLDPDNDIEAPEKRLMQWHYKQCVRMYVRGFWAP